MAHWDFVSEYVARPQDRIDQLNIGLGEPSGLDIQRSVKATHFGSTTPAEPELEPSNSLWIAAPTQTLPFVIS